MEYMKYQFLQSMGSEFQDDVSMISTASQDKDKDKHGNAYNVNAGEEQEPDDNDNDGTLSDSWNSFIDIIANKVECDKAPKGKAKAKDV